MTLILFILAGTFHGFPTPNVTTIRFLGLEYLVGELLNSGWETHTYAATKISGPYINIPENVSVKYHCTKFPISLSKMDFALNALGALEALESPNIMKLYAVSDVIEGEGPDYHKCRFLVSDRTGPTLDRYMSEGEEFNSPFLYGVAPISTGKLSLEAFAASLGLIVCDTVIQLHKSGVAHHEISTQNIALSYPDKKQPILINFENASTSRKELDLQRLWEESAVVYIIYHIIWARLWKEMGEAQSQLGRSKNPLMFVLGQVRDLKTLEQKLKAFLLEHMDIDWDRISNKEILYIKG